VKFCFITTFFGQHSFGGDAVFIERLSEALLDDGHNVHIIYNVDAYKIVQSNHSDRDYSPPDRLVIHPIQSRFGKISPIVLHQTGQIFDLTKPIQAILEAHNFDVIHVHNISLMGGAGLLRLILRYPHVIRLMTAHEYWLMCPLSVRWKFKRQTCYKRQCIPCTIHSGRPPQLWRLSNALKHELQTLDGLLFPSDYAKRYHQQLGFIASYMQTVPYFLPDSWFDEPIPTQPPIHNRPYFVLAGRIVKEKGFQQVIPMMKDFPDIDLLIAGRGDYQSTLEALASGLNNVHFLGQLDFIQLKRLYSQAIATIVPSLMIETFGYIWLESLAMKTPVIVRNIEPLAELVTQHQGGVVFDTPDDLRNAMQMMLNDTHQRQAFIQRGYHSVQSTLRKHVHLAQYFEIINTLQARKG
jgi:glycosyltransferase involved in cell wall biosynthesis